MVCIYCGGKTQVTNSRLQTRDNHIWRRRKCASCAGIFTTQEYAALGTSLVVRATHSLDLQPFSRDKLYISIYEACKHREHAIRDASYLTAVIVAKVLALQVDGAVTRDDIAKTATRALKHFDHTASTVYTAYHRV